MAVNHQEPQKYRFAMAQVDTEKTSWGVFGDTFLCYKDRVLTVCFIGRVISTFFAVGPGQVAPRCSSIKFKFLRDGDLECARKLVNAKARPPISMYPIIYNEGETLTIRYLIATTKRTFWAGKKCSVWNTDFKKTEVFCYLRGISAAR